MAYIILEGVRWINRRLDKTHPWEFSPARRFTLQLISNASFVLLITTALRVYIMILFDHYEFIRFLDEWVVASTAVVITFIVVLIELGMFFLQRWRHSLIELERFKKESWQFRFEMLKAQVNPHFLFNSLNTLSSLVFSDQETAHSFIRRLANVYRNVLEYRGRGLISLGEELTALQAYIDLIQLRFDDKLIIEIDIPGEKDETMVPPIILQMLIENAIKHNVASNKSPLKISLNIDGDYLVVTNNLQLKSSKGYSSRIGLDNICSHYDLVTDQRVIIKETKDEFIVKIPLLDPSYESINY
jgi:LytS/YehU family sensor histidine kinase